MTTPEIELASAHDVPELARLRWELYAEQGGRADEPLDAYRQRFERFARSALASVDWIAWVARDHGRPVGAMWLRTVHRVPVPGTRAGPIGYLTNVYVEPEHRNRGLGAAMLTVALDRCRREGYSEIVVWPTQRSRSFYRRSGFGRPDEPLVLRLVPDGPLAG